MTGWGWARRLTLLGVAAALFAPLAAAQPTDPGADMPARPVPYSQLAKPKAKPAAPKPKPPKPRLKAASPHTARAPTSAAPAPGVRPPAPKPTARPAAAHPAPKLAPAAPPPTAPAPASPRRPGARLAPGEPLPAAELEAFVDGVMGQGMAGGHVVGASVAVVQNGQPVLLKGYGEAALGAPGQPGRRVDPRTTLFRLGSGSTLFTAIEAIRAVEQERLDLNLPVNIYLRPMLRLPDEDVQRPILIRHLLTQTAGFEERTLGRLYRGDPARLVPLGQGLVRDRPHREFAPGAVASLSTYGTSLLGAALAETGRRPWNELMETELFGPLGMAHSSFREPYPARGDLPAPLAPALADGLARGYHWTGRGFEAIPFEFAQTRAPAASASTTAEDMARLMGALLNGGATATGRLYGPTAAMLLRTPMQKTPAGVSGWPGGLAAETLPGGFAASGFHGGTLSSHAAITLVPELKLGVFVAANTDTAAPVVRGLVARVVERFYAAQSPALRPGDPTLNAAAYAGRYVSTARARHGLEKVVERFTRAVEVRASPGGRLAIRQDGRTRLYAPDPGQAAAPVPFRAAEGEGEGALVFTLEHGRAVGFTPGDNLASYTRVGAFLNPSLLGLGALLVGGAAALTLVGLVLRARREELRRTDAQAIGGALQALLAVLWLAAIGCALAWSAATPSAAALMFGWPSGWLIAASALALIAFLGSLLSAVQLVEIWRADRRRAGWSAGRKWRHSATAAVFVLYGVLLTLWGALTPWSP